MISGGWSGSTSASVLLWPVPSRRRDWLVYRATGRDSGIYTVHVCMYMYVCTVLVIVLQCALACNVYT